MNRRNFIKAVAIVGLTPSIAFAKDPHVTVLGYHDIRDNENDLYSINEQTFETQMRVLHQAGYTTTTFDEVAKGNFGDKQIIITFDDGYKSFIETALPILRHYRFKSVVNVIGEYVGKEMPDVGETRKMMNWIDYGQLINTPEYYKVELGCHTYGLHHPQTHGASGVTDNNLLLDLAAFDGGLKLQLDYHTDIIAWPYGQYTQANIDTATRRYKYILTSNAGQLTGDTSLHEIPRFHINRDTTLQQFVAGLQ